MSSSYSKADKQTRYKFDIFKDYEDVEKQKSLHFIRCEIDKNYYYDNKSVEQCIIQINKIIAALQLTEEEQIEMERKSYFHLDKHIMLSERIEYNIKEVYKIWD